MKYKGIIFDFNGVLFWDNWFQENAWEQISEFLRGIPLTSEEMVSHVHGKPNKSIFEFLLNRSLTSDEAAKLSFQKESLYQSLCLKHSEDFKLSPGAIDLLEFLVKHNIPRTIATVSDANNINFFRNHLALDTWFNPDKISLNDGSCFTKLEIYLKAIKNIKLHAEECIVIEDSLSGIIAAQQAKIGKIIGFGPKKVHKTLLLQKGITETISSLDQFRTDLIS